MARKAGKPGKPGGRPPRREGERLAKNRTFRVRGQLDDRLQRAALNADRSVSEEIEHRLEHSFLNEQRSLWMYGGSHNERLARMIITAITLTPRWEKGDDETTVLQRAVSYIISIASGRTGDIVPKSSSEPLKRQRDRLAALLMGDPALPLDFIEISARSVAHVVLKQAGYGGIIDEDALQQTAQQITKESK